jgi:hypothetical protein
VNHSQFVNDEFVGKLSASERIRVTKKAKRMQMHASETKASETNRMQSVRINQLDFAFNCQASTAAAAAAISLLVTT